VVVVVNVPNCVAMIVVVPDVVVVVKVPNSVDVFL
jgi:hypothetical protein